MMNIIWTEKEKGGREEDRCSPNPCGYDSFVFQWMLCCLWGRVEVVVDDDDDGEGLWLEFVG